MRQSYSLQQLDVAGEYFNYNTLSEMYLLIIVKIIATQFLHVRGARAYLGTEAESKTFNWCINTDRKILSSIQLCR